MKHLYAWLRNEGGQTVLEYVLVTSFVSVALVLVLVGITGSFDELIETARSAFP